MRQVPRLRLFSRGVDWHRGSMKVAKITQRGRRGGDFNLCYRAGSRASSAFLWFEFYFVLWPQHSILWFLLFGYSFQENSNLCNILTAFNFGIERVMYHSTTLPNFLRLDLSLDLEWVQCFGLTAQEVLGILLSLLPTDWDKMHMGPQPCFYFGAKIQIQVLMLVKWEALTHWAAFPACVRFLFLGNYLNSLRLQLFTIDKMRKIMPPIWRYPWNKNKQNVFNTK